MADKKKRPRKVRTDLTGRDDVSAEEIIRGLTPVHKRKAPAKPKRQLNKWEKEGRK